MNHPQLSSANQSLLQSAIYFARLGRPLHLMGGFVFNGLGIMMALYLSAPINWAVALWCQVVITAAQLMTHYSNDYFDRDADAANLTPTRWAGGSRVLPDGLIPARLALTAALLCGTAAVLATVGLTAASPAPFITFWLALLAIFLAWSYSSPPLWLNRRGLGEITGALLVPGLTTLLAFQVQAGQLALLPLLAVIPLCLFQLAMLLSVNFPDAFGDTQVYKRTLIVKYGVRWTERLFAAALVLAYVLTPVLVWFGLPGLVGLALLMTAPIAVWQGWRIRQSAATDPAQWDALAFWSIGLLMSAAVLDIGAFLILVTFA